jgi:1,4-alpha-glucan branching enzyme
MAEGSRMGANPVESGVSFRIWAPNATAVSVTGDFNDWSETADPLQGPDNGFWETTVETATIGHEYRFILDGKDGHLSRIDPYARAVTNSIGNGIITALLEPVRTDFVPPAWNEMVIYEMHVGTFNTSKEHRPGTFDDAIKRFGHLRDLGINAIQIMPAMEFGGDLSWGYNPAHIFAVESAYGGPEAFRRFVTAAHEAGIAVILDVVYNHFGPSDLDLWRFDGSGEEGKGGIYFYNDWRSSTPWGDTRPDFGRHEVRSFIHDNALYWFEAFGLDGLRFDSTLNMRNVSGDEGDPAHDLPDGWSLMQWINDDIAARYPGRITIAEDLRSKDALTAPTSNGGAGFGAQWDADFVHPVRDVLIQPEDDHRSIATIVAALEKTYNGDPFQRVIYTESHDEVANGKARVPHEVDKSAQDSWFAQKRSTLGAVLTLTTPGIPMLFQGQEFLQGDWFDDSVPLDWAQRRDRAGIVQLYRDLITLRRNVDGLTKGLSGRGIDILVADEDRKVIVYRRFYDDDDPGVIVALNFRTAPASDIEIPLPDQGPWQLRMNSDWQGYSKDFEGFKSDALAVEDREGAHLGRFSIGPYSALMYSR